MSNNKYGVMKYCASLLFVSCLSLFFISCQQTKESISPDEQARIDSLALHVGVMPVMDCLPIYYAQKTRIFEDAGVDVQFLEYLSQMDCDTAIERHRVELAYGDVARTLLMKTDVRIVMGLDGKMSLVTARTKRIRQLKHLNERMVGLDRLSASDYWSDELMKKAGMEQAAIYRPQINDLRLRTSMLGEQLLDAALLPEPYATQLVRQGNRMLYTTNDSAPSLACLVVSAKTLKDTMRVGQIQRFFNAYNKAVEELNSDKRDNDALRTILCKQYELTEKVVDSLRIPRFPLAHITKSSDADIAVRWLKTREKNVKASKLDSLFCNRFIP